MCSIHGFNVVDQHKIERMNENMRHRGPDDSGSFFSRAWSLGHTRLSIIDLSPLGHQPMQTPDGRYVIVFNGEIYNYQELKKELEQVGYTFRSASDTEVLLYAYQAWGKACVERLNGMFAFAILDTQTEELFLARDHVGIKPLYYYHKDGRFIFASEAKALFAHDIDKTIKQEALNIYFRLLYIPSPLTIWNDIYKLPPAHMMTVKNGEVKIEQYWHVDNQALLSDRSEIEQQVKQLLTDAVRRQLVADRPVGVFLSGGIDSTILTGLASEMSPHINTFSVGFEATEEQEKYNNDVLLARKTAAHFGTTHHEVVVSANDILSHLPETIYHMDEPISNHIQTVNLLLARYTTDHAKVVLGGDGGDELFGGYERYYVSVMIDRLQHIPEVLRKNAVTQAFAGTLGKISLYELLNTAPGADRYLGFFAQKEAIIGSILKSPYNQPHATHDWISSRYFSHADTDFTRQFMRTDVQTWLTDESLVRSDKMGMASGLEQRLPFLDYRLVELADRIPVSYKLGKKGIHVFQSGKQYQGKQILISAMRDYLPDTVMSQPKWGWFSPAAKWIRGPLYPLMKEVLSPSYNRGTADMFDFVALEKMLEDHVSKKQYALNTLWSVMTFQLWYRQFMEK